MMKLLVATASLLVLSLSLTSCGNETPEADSTRAETPAPPNDLLAGLPADDDPQDNTFQTLDGRGFDVGALAGRKVFVNFWATWCAPCIREIPSINRAAAMLEPEGYMFLFVSDEDTQTIENFLEDRGFAGNFVKLNDYFSSYGIGAVPSSWLLDENGDLVAQWAGAYEWDSEEKLAEIRNPAAIELP